MNGCEWMKSWNVVVENYAKDDLKVVVGPTGHQQRSASSQRARCYYITLLLWKLW